MVAQKYIEEGRKADRAAHTQPYLYTHTDKDSHQSTHITQLTVSHRSSSHVLIKYE